MRLQLHKQNIPQHVSGTPGQLLVPGTKSGPTLLYRSATEQHFMS